MDGDISIGKVFYRKCSKCGYLAKVQITFKDGAEPTDMDANRTPCMQPAPWRTSRICGGSYSVPATEEEYNQKVLEYEQSKKEESLGKDLE